MCGRYAFLSPPAEVAAHFGLAECAEYLPRFNIPPGTDIPVIRLSPEGKRVLHRLRWGLVPHWAKDPAIGAKLNNARAEGVREKPSFRDAFRRRRCLIPASGFYEWHTEGRVKQPWYFSLKSGEPLAMGGLWESWRAPDGVILRTCAVITTEPNQLMAPVHDRMPVLIDREHWRDWLAAPPEAVTGLLAPPPAEIMRAWRVDRRVSRVAEDDAGLIEALAEDDAASP
ncbi:MAG: SOS response-associated peptidase [Betaproteobacteria bacterium]|nr:SOS response-associated peptidase [Betaproteobacteria bacterium]